jgi:methyl-accepting chemotaxis protein
VPDEITARPGEASATPRWDALGLALGVGFALAATALSAWARHGGVGPAALAAAQAADPVLWLADALPLALAAAGRLVRRRAARAGAAHAAALAAIEAEHGASFESMATSLAVASQDLLRRVSSIMAACSQTSVSVHETASTMQQLSATATQAALEAETVMGLAWKGERASETAGTVAETTGAALKAFADDVRTMAERIEGVHKRLRDLSDVAAAMGWLAERSMNLASTGARAACTPDLELCHEVAQQMRAHAEDAAFVAKQADGIVNDVMEAMGSAREAAEAGSRRAASDALLVQSTGTRIRDLGAALRDTAAAAGHIAQLAQQQGGAFDRVLQAMNEACLATESNVSETAAVGEASRALDALAAGLRRAVGGPADGDRA